MWNPVKKKKEENITGALVSASDIIKDVKVKKSSRNNKIQTVE